MAWTFCLVRRLINDSHRAFLIGEKSACWECFYCWFLNARFYLCSLCGSWSCHCWYNTLSGNVSSQVFTGFLTVLRFIKVHHVIGFSQLLLGVWVMMRHWRSMVHIEKSTNHISHICICRFPYNSMSGYFFLFWGSFTAEGWTLQVISRYFRHICSVSNPFWTVPCSIFLKLYFYAVVVQDWLLN